MNCSFCLTENAETAKACKCCGMVFEAAPTLALAVPAEEAPREKAALHPFAHPRRTRLFSGIKNVMAALLIVPVMAAVGGLIGALFFAIVIGLLDHFYFHPDLSLHYLEMLGRKSLFLGLFAGIPAGAYGALAAAGAFIRDAGKMLTGFCALLTLPFLVLPPFHYFPHILQISSPYHLPPGFMGGCLIAVPFLVFLKFYHSMFICALASKR
jgi:hypothetical protein